MGPITLTIADLACVAALLGTPAPDVDPARGLELSTPLNGIEVVDVERPALAAALRANGQPRAWAAVGGAALEAGVLHVPVRSVYARDIARAELAKVVIHTTAAGGYVDERGQARPHQAGRVRWVLARSIANDCDRPLETLVAAR